MGVCNNGRTLIRKSIQDSEGKGTHTYTQKEEEEEASETISNLILLYPRRKARALGEMSKKEGGKKKKKNGREREKIYKRYTYSSSSSFPFVSLLFSGVGLRPFGIGNQRNVLRGIRASFF
jgi:hypothetical protein